MPLPCPNARFVYGGKTYKPDEFRSLLNSLPVQEMAKYVPGVKSIPDAPFKKTWPELMLKRMIKYAQDHGYDGISWSPGDVQAERYDLSKQVDHIDYRRQGKDRYELAIVDKNGQEVALPKDDFSADELADIVGKDVAEKIVAGEGHPGGGRHTLRGLDLKVGGEGMKGFYDKIIPDAANKLGKQWGAKVGDIKLSIPPSVSRSQWSYEGPEYDSHELISIANRWFKEDVPVTLAHQASAIAADMRESGYSFQDAMQRNGSAALAAKLGGKMKMAEAEKKTIPYLPLNPQMRTGIKSLPYSLFAAGGAALGLNAVKQKADELQRKFRESGLAQ